MSQVNPAADQNSIDAGRMDQGYQGGVFHTADATALKVVHRHRNEFGEKEQVFRHCQRPGAQTGVARPILRALTDGAGMALYTAF